MSTRLFLWASVIIIALLTGTLFGYVRGRSAVGDTPLTTPTAIASLTAVPTAVTTPIPAPAATTPTPVAPTAVLPTAMPTVVDGQPGNPTFAFEPRSGGAGTVISLNGWGFTPRAALYLAVGFPANGPRLATMTADGAGRWQIQITIPELQLSPGPDWSQMHLVVTDPSGALLASAPFTWIVPSGPTLEGASQAVRDVLGAYVSGADTRPYLNSELRARVESGEAFDQILGLQPAALTSFTVGAPLLDRPSEVLFVPATLVYSVAREERLFTLVVVEGQWRIHGSFVEAPQPGPSRDAASQTVRDLLASFGGGTEAVRPFLASELRVVIDRGTPVHEALGLPPLAWQSFTVGAPKDLPSEVLFVPATLTYPTFAEQRRFTLVVEDGQWRVTGSAPVLGSLAPPAEALAPQHLK